MIPLGVAPLGGSAGIEVTAKVGRQSAGPTVDYDSARTSAELQVVLAQIAARVAP